MPILLILYLGCSVLLRTYLMLLPLASVVVDGLSDINLIDPARCHMLVSQMT